MIDYYLYFLYNWTMKYKGVVISEITIFATPTIYAELVGLLIIDLLIWLKELVIKRGIYLVAAILVWILVSSVEALQVVEDICFFAAYWVVLGIASSIGLGTGLHTFVLYLGPHIAKVALAATSCGFLPEMLPSRWTFDHFAECKNTQAHGIGMFGILLAVQIESFLWGLGTAIGELPPYFVAKKAAETRAELRRMSLEAESQGKPQLYEDEEQRLIENEKKTHHVSSEQIQQILELKRKTDLTLMDKAKIIIYDNMEKYGFWTILACASIPNPLFDLAGITCGHFRIPFKTFFTATFIGKAIIKVHIQMLFVIAIFRKESLAVIVNIIKSISSSMADSVQKHVEEQKKILYEPSKFSENKPIIAKLWDLFIIGMVAFFLKSILDAQVQQKAIALKDKN